MSKRDRTRRKVIFVISDGREFGSKASYSDVLKLLLAQGIQIKAVAVEGAALPLYSKLERLHLPREGYGNLLPRYASATGGGSVYTELSRNSIEESYAQITSEARNQYTLGYTTRATASTAYRDIEVRLDRPGLNINAKAGYYPVPEGRRRVVGSNGKPFDSVSLFSSGEFSVDGQGFSHSSRKIEPKGNLDGFADLHSFSAKQGRSIDLRSTSGIVLAVFCSGG